MSILLTFTKWLKSEVIIEKWQVLLIFIGFLLIITGLIIIISWQKGFVQLKWLQCPEMEIPFA